MAASAASSSSSARPVTAVITVGVGHRRAHERHQPGPRHAHRDLDERYLGETRRGPGRPCRRDCQAVHGGHGPSSRYSGDARSALRGTVRCRPGLFGAWRLGRRLNPGPAAARGPTCRRRRLCLVPTLCSVRLCGPLWGRASTRRRALHRPDGGLRQRADSAITNAISALAALAPTSTAAPTSSAWLGPRGTERKWSPAAAVPYSH